MHVEVKDPSSRVILSRHYAEEGRFVFTSHLPGEHSICIGTNSSRWYGGSQLVCNTQSIIILQHVFVYVILFLYQNDTHNYHVLVNTNNHIVGIHYK